MELILASPLIIFFIFIIVVIGIIITLVLVERKTKKGLFLKTKKESRLQESYNKITSLINSTESYKEKLDKLNKLARDFFEEYFNLSKTLTYYDIKEKLKSNQKITEFCNNMLSFLYTGKEIKRESLSELINSFYVIQRETINSQKNFKEIVFKKREEIKKEKLQEKKKLELSKTKKVKEIKVVPKTKIEAEKIQIKEKSKEPKIKSLITKNIIAQKKVNEEEYKPRLPSFKKVEPKKTQIIKDKIKKVFKSSEKPNEPLENHTPKTQKIMTQIEENEKLKKEKLEEEKVKEELKQKETKETEEKKEKEKIDKAPKKGMIYDLNDLERIKGKIKERRDSIGVE